MKVFELRVYMVRQGNMTITELAKRVNKSPATISRWFETGDMPLKYAVKIADVLGIPLENRADIFLNSV